MGEVMKYYNKEQTANQGRESVEGKHGATYTIPKNDDGEVVNPVSAEDFGTLTDPTQKTDVNGSGISIWKGIRALLIDIFNPATPVRTQETPEGIAAIVAAALAEVFKVGVGKDEKQIAHNVGAVSGATEIDCRNKKGLIMIHTITGAPTGGWATLKPKTAHEGTQIPSPWPAGDSAFGLNVKNGNQTASYMSVFLGLPDYVDCVLSRADGTHLVEYILFSL
jgi:hypothetical protein